MRKRQIAKLDYKERQWLFQAAIQLIIADKSVAEEEVEELKLSLKHVAGAEYSDMAAALKSPKVMAPLKPMKNIDYEHALIIVFELARIAAIDSKVVLEESSLLSEVLSLLNFKREAITMLIDWTKRLALVNQEEDKLKKDLKQHYQPL